jgi:hypothetical protein
MWSSEILLYVREEAHFLRGEKISQKEFGKT